MQYSDLPAFFNKVFAEDATGSYIRPIPDTTTDPAAASLSLGFPPQTFTDESAGGTPPDGRDFNGMLNRLSAWAQWQGAGGPVRFSTAVVALGGYPIGARVASASVPGLSFVSIVDGNTTDPEAVGAAGWQATGRGATSGTARWEYQSNGDIHQYGTVGYDATGTPNVNLTITMPRAFTTPLRVIATASQQPNPGWAATTCIASFIGGNQIRFVLSSGNTSQFFTQGGQISWDAIGN